jgi:hypothetical protein
LIALELLSELQTELLMKFISKSLRLCRAVAVLFFSAMGYLLGAKEESEEDTLSENGSGLWGEHNFRTGRLDAGTDPDGWYEEDL